MNRLKILITGGDGFIAKNLFEYLKDEYTVVALNSKELNLLDSARVLDYLKSNRFDIIIHTATYDAAARYSTKSPAKILENNLRMFFNLIRCKNYFSKMLYFGSGAEYSREYWQPKMKEEYFDQHVPTDQYGFSKYIMTKYTQLTNNIYNLRLFGVFGKYDDWKTRFIPNACCHAVMDIPISINQNRYFDFLYITDLIRIVRWFINNHLEHRVYNVCTGKPIDFKTISEKIIKISGKQLEVIIKTEGLALEYSGDNSLLLNELKGFEFSSIDESLKELYDWYEANKHIIEKDKL